MTKEKTLREHMSDAAKARHAKRTPAERSAHARMMVQAREAKRQARKEAAECTCQHLKIGSCRKDYGCSCARHA